MKTFSFGLLGHFEYLEWPEQQVQLPRLDVYRQTTDKKCSYLENENASVTTEQ